ncbi:hypothetical protein [Hephaestia mangrovi]|uniref:hypothetical protein n=1 Tax=Hephaestia mangrovi TaxID=2873268 RepID=UPI001CA6C7C4|nr:hypothetical protein [Hephaestia mangrovi]MBY8828120.1 hypothetical protein [Hephaestia mangrovi]
MSRGDEHRRGEKVDYGQSRESIKSTNCQISEIIPVDSAFAAETRQLFNKALI